MSLQDDVIADLKARFADRVLGEGSHVGQRWLDVKREGILDLLRACRDDHGCDVLMDLCGVDWLDKGMPERFCVVYELVNLKKAEHVRIKAWVPEDDPEIDTASDLWKAAPWAEREVYDMYGLTFRGHGDLRRILLPDAYQGHPLRKDYPLVGHGERQNFPRYGL